MKLCSVFLVAFHFSFLLFAQTNFFQAPGTLKMAERLKKIAAEINPESSMFFCEERVQKYGSRILEIQDPGALLRVLPTFASDLLNSGYTQPTLDTLSKIKGLLENGGPEFPENQKLKLRTMEALAYLRLGEQENCLSNHTTASCLLPIRGEGIHKLQRGSREGIRVLSEILKDFPQNLKCRWLLNVAYMTIGEYPDKVPPQWLIPPKAFASEYDLPRFRDVADVAGVNVFGLSGGSVMDDFDGDGLLDLMTTCIGFRAQMRFFHNNGDGTFEDRTQKAGLLGEVGGLNMVQADYNNDGFLDVLVLRGAWFEAAGRHPNSLLKNNGDGTFSDVTEEAALLSFHPTQTGVWFDYNGDGFVDLFIGNESSENNINPCELFRNNRNGTFTECAASAGVANVAFVKGVASADYNNDGRPDLYLSRRGAQNVLYRNDGPRKTEGGLENGWTFTDVGQAAGVVNPIYSFPTWFWDYDNDGWEDLFVCGYRIESVGDVAADYLGLQHSAERPRLYHNNRDGTFTDVTKEAGLYRLLHAMGSNFGDLDNDGFLDFYLGTGDPDLGTLIPNRMFRNAGGRSFQDVTTAGGFGHLQKGHGVSFGDIDNDGDQDIFEEMGGAFAGDTAFTVLYENPGTTNHWLKLKLEGRKSNREAIGARIKVRVVGPGGTRQICRTVGSGGSFGCNPLRQEIGLGDATTIESLEIFWPVTGKTQVFKELLLDRFYQLREEESELVRVRPKSFEFATSRRGDEDGHHHHVH